MVTKVRYKLQCPKCAHKFYSDTLFPECPKCDYSAELPDDDVISMPAIRSAVAPSVDKVYRDMERASEARVEQAAAMAGVPASEMSGLKLTNLRDNTREGEIAAMPVVNDVTRQMDLIKSRGGQVGFTGGAEMKAGISTGNVVVNGQITTGIDPRAGNKTMHIVNPNADANTLNINQS